MAKKRITIKELSKNLGLSTATISRAFSAKGRISEHTREIILKKAGELGYRPNANARNLILRKSDSIGFFYTPLIEREPDYFIAEIMLGANEAALESGMRLQIYPIPRNGGKLKGDFASIILDGSLEGIIVLGGTDECDTIAETARKSNVPCIVISDIGKPVKGFVGFNSANGAEQAGIYFAENARTHPVFISGIQDERKICGFRRGLGSDLSSQLKIDSGGTTFADGGAAFDRIIDKYPDTDCVFCANDVLAIGFIKKALENGVRIPEDISVIGCDNILFAGYHTPSLTTIRIPKYTLGRKAVDTLLNELPPGTPETAASIMECELVIRDSA